MAAIRNILNVYEKADSAKKVDIIIRYYPNFLGIVDSYTEGLRYMIENEKAYNWSKSRGDLGVRVQTSGKHSDITADTSLGLHTFQEIAKEANAVYKVKRCVLVNLDMENEYLEKCRVIGEGAENR